MIFWIGFTIMFLNEGFVIMRHVSPFFARQRDKLIDKFGDGWQAFHGVLDYLWVIVVVLGLIFSPNRLLHLFFFKLNLIDIVRRKAIRSILFKEHDKGDSVFLQTRHFRQS